MTSILSAISGYFSKSILLGTALPVALFIILNLLFVVPLLPPDWALLRAYAESSNEAKAAYVAFAIVLISGVLYNFDIPLMRLYEGYPWQETWLGERRTRRFRQEFDDVQNRLAGVRTVIHAMEDPAGAVFGSYQLTSPVGSPPDDALKANTLARLKELAAFKHVLREGNDAAKWSQVYAQVNEVYQQLYLTANKRFPSRRGLVLPTRLGNVIRSFEDYPAREFGMDPIEVWPRLIAKIDKDYAVAIDDAKTPFDFMLHCSALSAALSLLLLTAGLLRPLPLAVGGAAWAAQIIVFALLSYCFYVWSLARAESWGAMVKGAFDLYRNPLLEQLGYHAGDFSSRAAEREVWTTISQQMLYGRASGRVRDYLLRQHPPELPTFARAGDGTPLDFARGSGGSDDDGSPPDGTPTVELSIYNPTGATVNELVIVDTLPGGLEYEWGSASAWSARTQAAFEMRVTGANPYRFHLDGEFEKDDEVRLSYKVVQRQKK